MMKNKMMKAVFASTLLVVGAGAANAGLLADPGLVVPGGFSTILGTEFDNTQVGSWHSATADNVTDSQIDGYQVLAPSSAPAVAMAGFWQVADVTALPSAEATFDISYLFLDVGSIGEWAVTLYGFAAPFSEGDVAPDQPLSNLWPTTSPDVLANLDSLTAAQGIVNTSIPFFLDTQAYSYLLVTAYAEPTPGVIGFNSIDINPIPEPGTFVLGGILFALTATMIRRKGKAAA